TVGIVAGTCAAAAPHGNAIDGCRIDGAAFTAYTEICTPRVATKPSCAAVGATAAARILVVGHGIRVSATAACVAGRSAGHAAIGSSSAAGITRICLQER